MFSCHQSSVQNRTAQDESLTQPRCQHREIQDACLSTEIRAGMTTFATMSYIIAVNVRGLLSTLHDLSLHELTRLSCRHSSLPSPAMAAPAKSRGIFKATVLTRPSGQSATMVCHPMRETLWNSAH